MNMKEFLQEFCDLENFPVNVYIVLTVLGEPVTGWALGGPFGRLVFSGELSALPRRRSAGRAAVAGCGGAVRVCRTPIENPWRKLWVVLIMAGAVYAAFKFGDDAALRIYAHEWEPLGPALLFWLPMALALAAMFEERDAYDQARGASRSSSSAAGADSALGTR